MISTKIFLINAPNLLDLEINDFHVIKWDTSGGPKSTNTRGEVKPSASLSPCSCFSPIVTGLTVRSALDSLITSNFVSDT